MPLPIYAVPTSTEVDPQVRLMLVGPPKSGKTYAATTFPNPLIVDFDNGLTSAELRAKKLATLPFYDEAWLRTQYKQLHPSATSPLKPASAFVTFLNSRELMAMDLGDTLVLDSLSTLSDAVKFELTPQIPVGKDGKDDGYWYWRNWSNWFAALCTKIKSLRCNVVLIAHEQEIRDSETGRVNAFKYILQGQEFSPRLPQFFTDIYRQTKEVKEVPGTAAGDKLAKRVTETYLWQIKSSPQFMCETRMKTDRQFVPANYSSFSYTTTPNK